MSDDEGAAMLPARSSRGSESRRSVSGSNLRRFLAAAVICAGAIVVLIAFNINDGDSFGDTLYPTKPPLDSRHYKFVTLSNNLRVLLVNDPETETSAASLQISVGSLADPPDTAGLAHFCEHMLFMGSSKFPKENTFGEYLSSHGGASNAWTGDDQMNFFFRVRPDSFQGALDIWSRFFIDPLFDAGSVDRELHAVDSEHSKNLQSDMWRVSQLVRTVLAPPTHPFNHFGAACLLVD